MDDLEIQIRSIFERYASAVLAKDVEAFVALYSPDVRVFDTWGKSPYESAAAWRTVVEKWFTSIANETEESVTVRAKEIRVTGGTDLAMASAMLTYAAVSPSGQTLRSMQNRLTWVLVHSSASWLIVHEHTSMPINPGDMHAVTNTAT